MNCDKKCYGSKKGALKFIRKGSKNLQKKAGRIRAYFCKECNAWHLTSHERGT